MFVCDGWEKREKDRELWGERSETARGERRETKRGLEWCVCVMLSQFAYSPVLTLCRPKGEKAAAPGNPQSYFGGLMAQKQVVL